MPLYKRKPFPLLDPPPIDRKDNVSKKSPVWYSQLTHEIYDDYSLYIQRTSLYRSKQWQCESTGRSNLTYAEALESERVEREKLQNKLPDTLQKAVLEYLQFQSTRLDSIVDSVYNYFVDRYVIDEHVDCEWDDGSIYETIILEVPPLEKQISDDAKYKVQLIDEDSEPIDDSIKTVSRKDFKRDRFAFSKNLLRKFIRESTIKETYVGAPWVVNDVFAKRFNIDTTLPKDLEEKRALAYKKSRKMRAIAAAERRKELENSMEKMSEETNVPKVIKIEDARKIESLLKYPMEDLDLPAYRRVEKKEGTDDNYKNIPKLLDMTPGTGNEDLEVPNPMGDLPIRPKPTQSTVSSDSYGLFLMVWSFLNVFSKPLHLSPFNMDDFESALRYSSTDHKYELIYEVVVSLLNCIIRYRLKHGNQNLSLLPTTIGEDIGSPRTPLLASHLSQTNLVNDSQSNTPDSSSQEEDDDDEELKNKDEKQKNNTRKQSQQQRNNNQRKSSNGIKNRDQSYLERGCGSPEIIKIGNNWDSNVILSGNDRNGWEDVLIGCINDLTIEYDEDITTFDRILCSLIPDLNSSLEDRQEAYILLNLKDKLRILQLLIHAVNETPDIKEYMEECQEQLTELRKQKIELNREKRRIQIEKNEIEKQYEHLDISSNNQNESEESSEDSDEESEDDGSTGSRNEDDGLNRHESRQAVLKRKQQQLEEREAKRKKLFHQQRQVARERNQELKARSVARKKVEEEERAIQRKVDQVDRDMRKYSTLRFKPLGRDKFYNRYYYLDNIGSGYSHGSGKLFVQSPSAGDLLVLLERDNPETYQNKKDNLTTSNTNSSIGILTSSSAMNSSSSSSMISSCGHGGGLKFVCQLMKHQGLSDKAELLQDKIHDMINGIDFEWWETIDDPDNLTELLEWLNPKGNREYLLKREIEKHASVLITGMKKHSNDRQLSSMEATRRSTRTRNASQHPTGSWFSYTNKLAK